jgi:Cu(I)/Ag(I) efflux system periplasmic protein CusF
MLFDTIRVGVLAALALMSPLALAQDTEGEVRKIDKAQSKVTLRHGEIKNLDMPAMTMVFRIKEPKLLDSVAVGDKVKFAAEKIDGNYVVTQITKTP